MSHPDFLLVMWPNNRLAKLLEHSSCLILAMAVVVAAMATPKCLWCLNCFVQ